MKRDNFPSCVDEILERVFTRLGINKKLRELKALRDWKEVVGEKIEKHTYPLRVRKGNLFIVVDSSGWLAQITYFKEKIISELNQRQGKEVIKDIYLRVGKVKHRNTCGPAKDWRIRRIKLEEQELEEIKNKLNKIEDKPLRKILNRVLVKDKKLKKIRSKIR
ncbi:DUF721 domain-containing protein [Candidatus Aerophobetes bacterium]|nr:DUF721 domain-containing protein [Candidatus Aerophobetes bacterium]